MSQIQELSRSYKNNFSELAHLFYSRDFSYELEDTINSGLNNAIQTVANTQQEYDTNSKNIIKELDKYSNDNNSLTEYMQKLINESNVYLPFDEVALQEVPDNNRIISRVASTGYVLYPSIEGMSFTNNILDSLHRQNQNRIPRDDGLNNELTVFEIQPAFPFRHIKKLKRLAREYDMRYQNNNSSQIDVEIHLEGSQSDYNDFLLSSIGEVQENLNALDIINYDEQIGLHIDINDGEEFLKLGNDFKTSYRELRTIEDTLKIQMILDEKLKGISELDYQPKEDKRKAVLAKIYSKYQEIKKYYWDKDKTKIPFWKVHCDKAIAIIKAL